MTRFRNWLLAVFLAIPILWFFLASLYNHDGNLVATGFIQYDNVTYAGNAFQYTWSEHQGIFYSNRLNDSHTYPRIYFNPQLLILAGFMKAGIPAGIALMLFTLLSAVFFFRIVIAIYDHLKNGNKYWILNLVLFCWGGGLLCASGFILHLAGFTSGGLWESLFTLDPAYGWWGLNAGRSLFFSLEAWYHALFFGIILCILKRRWALAILLLFLLSTSHPFTGIELLLILAVWMISEKFFNPSAFPLYFFISVICILAFHIWYYLIWLNKFPEHYSIFRQYSLNWRYRFYHFIPAYLLTGCLLVLTLRIEGLKLFLSKGNNRLFICWGLVAFTLANHELFIKPMQPIHFTRGYIWSALFLAGLPGLNYLWDYLSRRKGMVMYMAVFLMLFLSDNLLWIWKNSRRANEAGSVTHITNEQSGLVDLLSRQALHNDLIVGMEDVVPYLASIKTKSNIWISHPFNTPFYSIKKSVYTSFLETGEFPLEWQRVRIFFIVNKANEQEVRRFSITDSNTALIHQSPNYLLFLRTP